MASPLHGLVISFGKSLRIGESGRSASWAGDGRGVVRFPNRTENGTRIDARRLRTIYEAVLARQTTFSGIGGSHAASAATTDGEVRCVFEDIARHYALHNAVGFLLGTGFCRDNRATFYSELDRVEKYSAADE